MFENKIFIKSNLIVHRNNMPDVIIIDSLTDVSIDWGILMKCIHEKEKKDMLPKNSKNSGVNQLWLHNKVVKNGK